MGSNRERQTGLGGFQIETETGLEAGVISRQTDWARGGGQIEKDKQTGWARGGGQTETGRLG